MMQPTFIIDRECVINERTVRTRVEAPTAVEALELWKALHAGSSQPDAEATLPRLAD
jgi:hypothetical protein